MTITAGGEGTTPTLAETVNVIVDRVLSTVSTSQPGVITKYDSSTQLSDVQPVLQKKYEDGTIVDQPIVPNVPVVILAANGGKAYIHMPVKKGDQVILLTAQRSLDNWITQGGESVDPADRRKFNISDSVAIIGGRAKPDALHVQDPNALEVSHSKGVIQLKDDNTITVFNDKATLTVKPDGEFTLVNDNVTVSMKDDGTILISNTVGVLKVMANGTVYLFKDGATEPFVLGTTLVNALTSLVSDINSINTALIAFGGALAGATDPVVQTAGAALSLAITAVVTSLTTFVTTYLTNPASNILSQKIFGARL